MDIKQNMRGCIEILHDFGIANSAKCDELYARVDKGELTAYKEISTLLEEVTTTLLEIAEEVQYERA